MLYGVDPTLFARMSAMRAAENPYASGAAGQVRPVADPQHQTAAHLNSFAQDARLVFGVIMDSTVIANCYRVHVDKCRAPVVATMLTNASASYVGTREINFLHPGDYVWVLLPDRQSYGVIVGVLPYAMTSANKALSDVVSQASRTRVDEGHRRPLKMLSNGSIPDWSGGRPLDNLAGDWGAISSTGIKITLDDFMAQLAVDEMCGVTAFYHDQLLRLAAYNLQLWTAGHEREGFHDQGEYNDSQLYTPYPWEQLGLFAPGAAYNTRDAATSQICEPWYSIYEPLSPRQQPFHRIQVYEGYLGQGGRRIVVAPPQQGSGGVNTYQAGSAGDAGQPFQVRARGISCNPPDESGAFDDSPLTGLHEDNITLNGTRTIRVAKSLVLSKRLLIPSPRRKKRPDDNQGDNEGNYRFAGQLGGGPAHQVTGDIQPSEPTLAHVQRAAAVLDLHAYLFNYAGLHPFHYHFNDYDTPQESELQYANANQFVPQFTSLAESMYLQPPTPKQLQIDHRYGSQDYYETESYISMLDDGGITIGDGYGAEIRLTGGQIFLSAPGDIWLKSGRDIQAWAGYDLCVRAKNSIDVSSTDKDVRIKAEKNLHMLAGNGKQGGILLESRAEETRYDFTKTGEDVISAGIMFKAGKSDIVGWGSNIYLRTGGCPDKVNSGDIILDADRGERSIITHSLRQHHYAQRGIYHFFGSEGSVTASNEFTPQHITLGAPASVIGPLVVTGTTIVNGHLIVPGGHIATEYAKQASFFVAELKGKGLTDAQNQVSAREQHANSTLTAAGNSAFAAGLDALFYAEQRAGHEATICNAEFSFRNRTQYKTQDFILFEDRWQQLARLGDAQMPTWKEKPVACTADPETYPYPGKENFQGDVLRQQDLNLCKNEQNGFRSVDRGDGGETASGYLEPSFAAPQAKSLDDYAVIVESSSSS